LCLTEIIVKEKLDGLAKVVNFSQDSHQYSTIGVGNGNTREQYLMSPHPKYSLCLIFAAAWIAAPEHAFADSHSSVEWSADLTGSSEASVRHADGLQPLNLKTMASGKASVAFDFEHQVVTLHVEAKDIANVRAIQLRSSRERGDLNGPTIMTIYESNDGPFTGSASKTVKGPDFNQVATPIVNGQSVVVICTAAHPDGEIAGVISMHKIPMAAPNS
jgi:tRNA threonylcarbamoyladenosine modification (KEOPS) complex  Pcc1 subunit